MEEQKKKKRKWVSTATIRKAYTKAEVSTKMMSFRLDKDLIEKLDGEVNKGRLINNLLREHYREKGG